MEGFEGLIAVIIIVVSLVASAKKAKTASKNVPGRKNAARPVSTAQAKPAARPAAPVKSAQPAQPAAEPVQSAVPVQPQVLNESDYARADLDEGDSRECDHGSVGGSMDITSHAGMGDEFVHAQQMVKTTVATSVKTQVKVRRDDMPPEEPEAEEAQPDNAAIRSAAASMNAEQMRQAVIMAEIMKRPSERFRRWPAR